MSVVQPCILRFKKKHNSRVVYVQAGLTGDWYNRVFKLYKASVHSKADCHKIIKWFKLKDEVEIVRVTITEMTDD